MIIAAAFCCSLTGLVHSPSGAPLHDVTVSAGANRATTDANGRFTVHVEPGKYTVRAAAQGYATSAIGPVDVSRDADLDVTLEPADAPDLRVISSVRVNGSTVPARNTVPATEISRAHAGRAGVTRVVDALTEIPSLTFARPDGGASTAPYLVALRGPDPSETLVALDGQILNDNNTGDLDLAHFPMAAFNAVSVVEGLGPSDATASNTIGGAVNFISLRPTRESHAAASYSFGSFGSADSWLNSTGSAGRVGYAFALDDNQTHGFVDQTVTQSGTPLHLGSTVSARSALANVSYAFSQRADASVRVFTLGNRRDLSGALNAPVDPSAAGPGDGFEGPGAATFAQSIRAYALRGRAPLGAGTLVADADFANDDANLQGAGVSPYDLTHRDKRNNASLAWQHETETSLFAAGGYVRNESLDADGVAGTLRAHIASYFVRGAFEPVSRIRVEGGAFASHYSTFGSNLDARAGISWQPTANDSLRASAGTGFRAPLLIERYEFPLADLPPADVNCVITGQGNAGLGPEHATEYELAYGHRFEANTSVDVALYRTNLRDAIENYYPLNACASPNAPLVSFPINVGNVVYQGGTVRLVRRAGSFTIDARYGVNVAYPYNLPETVANPTSGSDLVAYRQFAHIPQQQASLLVDYDSGVWHAAADASYRGKNNELNQGPYAVVNAGVGKRFGSLDVTLSGSNVFNSVSSSRFTLPGDGVPYDGIAGPLPTDRLFLEPAAVRLTFTLRK